MKGLDQNPHRNGRRTARLLRALVFGLGTATVFGVGMQYGAMHPDRTPYALWQARNGGPSAPSGPRTKPRPADAYDSDELQRLLAEVSPKVESLIQACEDLEQSER